VRDRPSSVDVGQTLAGLPILLLLGQFRYVIAAVLPSEADTPAAPAASPCCGGCHRWVRAMAWSWSMPVGPKRA